MPTYTIVIPAYQPTESLLSLVNDIIARDAKQNIIVIDDGSDLSCQKIFSTLKELSITVLHHEKNLGKGAALKTGFSYWLSLSKETRGVGVVTADADGQHTAEDIAHVGEALIHDPDNLYIGTRSFENDEVPLRSKFGNLLTRFVFRNVAKVPLKDTQSGLRALPLSLIEIMIKREATGYEFELDMLLEASENHITIKEIPIHTIYIDQNISSHFNPLIDSLKIYFVFLRYTSISLISATIDFSLFVLAFHITGFIFFSTFFARLFSGTFNFLLNRHLVFRDKNHLGKSAFKYACLLVFSGTLSYLFISFLVDLGIHVYLAKIFAEIIVYFVNFIVQKTVVFKKIEEAL